MAPKRNIYLLIPMAVLFLAGCNGNQKNVIAIANECPNKICISYGKLNNTIEWPWMAVIYHDSFYLLYDSALNNSSKSIKKLIVTDMNGSFIKDIYLPEGIQDMSHYDLRVDTDSLYIKGSYSDERTFVFDEDNDCFVVTKPIELKFFEDELYNVYSRCNGEWGGTIYFTNKKTHESFEAAAGCPLVLNKLDNEYYLTNFTDYPFYTEVLRIKDPQKLERSPLNFGSREGSLFRKGVEVLVDTMDVFAQTAFFINKQLYLLHSTDDSTTISKVVNGKLEPYYNFDFTFYAFYNKHLDRGKQLLTCLIKPMNPYEDPKYGLLLIDGKGFRFYFKE